ncbi:acyltransferase family protein [Paraburkholderia saeva]|uniref:acyltransferase family protein n=1 Tax=Paraburkholderia saeva TaxID=2777537 RepID=UPI001D62F137|nr:acyltransferase [Paraburkholderia saeva]CAG4887113.1 hypothetical protein R70241_00337 [Paraburkholderia saeva]
MFFENSGLREAGRKQLFQMKTCGNAHDRPALPLEQRLTQCPVKECRFAGSNQKLARRFAKRTRSPSKALSVGGEMARQLSGHFEQLDSLRGLAAISVVFSHFTTLDPGVLALSHTPMRMFMGGREAVILFFVLSGFVLTPQFLTKSSGSYSIYLVKRITRIYFPYLFSLLVALSAYALCFGGEVDNAGEWFNTRWTTGLSGLDVVRHIIFILPFDTGKLIPVIWSLVYEMRISIFLPVIAFAVSYWKTWRVLGVSLAISIAVAVMSSYHGVNVGISSVFGSWSMTAHYQLMFVVGASIAKNLPAICVWFERDRMHRWLTGIGIVFFFISHNIAEWVSESLFFFVGDWATLAGATCILVCAILSSRTAKALCWPPFLFFGQISYSLYLYHCITILAVVHGLARYGLRTSLLISAASIVPVAYFAWKYVERPSIAAGHAMARMRAIRINPGA